MISRFILFLFVLSYLYACKSDSNQFKAPLSQEEVTQLETDGVRLLDSDPEKALANFKTLAQHHRLTSDRKGLATAQLNIASIFDEHIHNLDSALYYATLSQKSFNNIGETMQEANLMKYVGLLKGRTGNIMGAFKDINMSKEIYERLEFPQGIAVANFNLAQVFYEEKNYDQSLILLDHATQFWKQNGGQSRVFSNNLFGIKLYRAMGDMQRANDLIAENQKISQKIEINSFQAKEFEKLIKK